MASVNRVILIDSILLSRTLSVRDQVKGTSDP